VVATKVRDLAGSSSSAAKEIKGQPWGKGIMQFDRKLPYRKLPFVSVGTWPGLRVRDRARKLIWRSTALPGEGQIAATPGKTRSRPFPVSRAIRTSRRDRPVSNFGRHRAAADRARSFSER
jgi:hypothetical protein